MFNDAITRCSRCSGVLVRTHDFACVCSHCGLVDETQAYIFETVNDDLRFGYKGYKVISHWNEYIAQICVRDPCIPYDVACFIEMACEYFRLVHGHYPQTKGDIKRMLVNVYVPDEIGKQYVTKHKFNVHKKYFERWRTILVLYCNYKHKPVFTSALEEQVTNMFKNFVSRMNECKHLIKRKILFHNDFLMSMFLISIDDVSDTHYYKDFELWLSTDIVNININTLTDYNIVAHRIGLILLPEDISERELLVMRYTC